MKNLTLVVLIIFLPFVLNAQTQPDEPLKLIGTIPIPGLHDGDFDHFAVDSLGQRLFLTAEENSAVEVFDLGTHDGDEQLVSLLDQGPPSGDVPWDHSSRAATEHVHAEELLGLLADRSRDRDEPGNLPPRRAPPFVIQRHPLLPS